MSVGRELVLVPFTDYRVVLGDAADGLDIAVHPGGEPPTDDVLGRTALYVLPYMGGSADLELIARMPALRAVQTLTAGVDDVWPYLPSGVGLHNAAGVHDASTAELAVALVLARLRGIDGFARAQEHGRWLYARHEALADKRVLILGHGHIGAAVERRLAGFEVEVVRVASRARTTEAGLAVHGVEDLPALLPEVDVVVVVVPLTPGTTGLVDAAFLAAMRRGALLVNVSRGAVVVTDDLLAALREGQVVAALDVTDPEPLPPDHPLWHAPGVLVSPHVGGNTTAFLPRAHRLVAAQLRRWRAGEPLANLVTRPGADPAPAAHPSAAPTAPTS